MELTRRNFLGTSTAAVLAAGTMANGAVLGANNRIRMGVIGLNGRGRSHMQAFSESPNSEVVAVCDVDKKVLDAAAENLHKTTGKRVKKYTDMRDMFADAKIDAVSIATPNHWHSLATIWACRAGKDVYVEKPISHDVWEGRQVVEVVQKSGRIVQHGTQNRSNAKWIRTIQRIREGAIGDVFMARALCFKRRDSIGFKPDEAPPKNVNWNLWQGPAQERPYNANYVHYNWHWFWDYGNGDIGNQGVHQMDVAVWGMGKGLPVRCNGVGGRYGYDDQAETPNTLVTTHTYADGTQLVFEVRGRGTNDEGGVRIGNLFYGAKGFSADNKLFDPDGKEIPDPNPPTDLPSCFENFLTAVRSRKEEDVRATALDGHLAAAHCHLGNIAYRLGRELRFSPNNERFVNDAEADSLLKRHYRREFEIR